MYLFGCSNPSGEGGSAIVEGGSEDSNILF